MTNEELSHFNALLEEIREELKEILAGTRGRDSIKPDNAIGRVTRMEAIQAQSMTDEGRRRQEARLRQEELALEMIAKGSYGMCVTCGSEIPKGRLEIMPEARLCMTCASRGR